MIALDSALDESLTPATSSRTVRLGLGVVLTLHLVLSLWLGWLNPGPARWWDERFNVLNIEAILRPGGFELANGYYGGVSYLPQTVLLAIGQRVHETTGRIPPLVTPAGRLTAPSYHLLRASQALWGSATLLLLFLLARRLLRPEGALLAVVLMAVTPRLYHSSAIFKPDIELVAATLLALLWSWRAALEPPRLTLYLAAGAAIGLAVGAKLNGVAVAFPLALATLLASRTADAFRRWSYLAIAGVASFLTFWAFNPDLPRVLRSLQKNQAHYDRTATGSRVDVLTETLRYPFTEDFHGPWIAVLGGLGLVALALWLVRRRGDTASTEPRLRWAMLVSYPPVYYLLYALASPRAKANHFLLVVPFVALMAALALSTITIALRHRRRAFGWLAAGGLALLIVPPATGTVRWIHTQAVPSTWDLAQHWVEAHLPPPSRAFRVGTVGQKRRGEVPGSPVYQLLETPPSSPADSRTDLPTDAPMDLDAILLPHRELDAWMTHSTWAPWIEGAQRQEFPNRFLRAREDGLSVILRPHRRLDHPAAGRILFHRGSRGILTGTLPEALRNRRLSLRIRLAIGDRWAPQLRLTVGERLYPLTLGPPSGGDVFLLSPRFDAGGAEQLTVTLEERDLQPTAKGELFVWPAE